MLPFKHRSLRSFRVTAVFLVSALSFEFLFRLVFALSPNDTAWETHPLYNFEAVFARTPSRGSGDKARPRIVIAGSSLATYGYLPQMLEEQGFDAVVAAHQGMHGLELAAHAERYASLMPDIVVIPVNMVDLRIERPMLLGSVLEGPARQNALQSLCTDLASMYGVTELAGTGLWREFPQCISLAQKAKIAAGLSYAYRLRTLARPGWEASYSRLTRGKSYEHYAGMPVVDADGLLAVTHRGHVPLVFRVTVTDTLVRRGLDLEILADSALVTVSGAQSKQLGRGWQRLAVSGRPGDVLEVSLNRGVYFETFADTYAARLSQDMGGRTVTRSANGTAYRQRRREDELYERMDNAAYRKSFELRNLAFGRPGYEYLKALYDAKSYWAGRQFDSDLPAVQGLARFVRAIRAQGVRVVVVNAPENPLTLGLYSRTVYYAGYLQFLKELGGADFLDASESLPMQMFYDYHHLSYGGAERMTGRLSSFLKSASQP